MISGLEVALGLLTGAEASHLFYGRLPSKMTTRKFATGEDKQNNLTAIGESVVVGLFLAGVVAYAMKSLAVFGIALAMMVFVGCLYLNDIFEWW